MPPRLELAGQTFGRLRVIRDAGTHAKFGTSFWRCRCRCGTIIVANGTMIKSGKTSSCGCRKSETSRANGKANAVHGESKKTPEYACWIRMKQRCLNPKDQDYKLYGGRDISICARWLRSYENFLNDMGRRPSTAYSIDRIDPDGNYEPSNCRWATQKQQQNNRRNSKHRKEKN